MTAQLRWPSTNQKTAWRTFLVVGDMRGRVSQVGSGSRVFVWVALFRFRTHQKLDSYRAFPVAKNRLRTQEDVANAVSRSPISCVVHYGFSRHQKLQAWRDGKFYDFVKTVSRRKLGRILRRYKTCFKLQIPHRRDRRGSGNGGAPGICFGFFLDW